MARKSEADAAKERKRADAARRHAKRYANPEYRARIQKYVRKRLAEKRADPEWHAEYKKQRKYYRKTGKYLPNRKLSRQQAYDKFAANPEWRERNNAKQRERYHHDPAFRTRKLARQRRLYRARKKMQKAQGNG